MELNQEKIEYSKPANGGSTEQPYKEKIQKEIDRGLLKFGRICDFIEAYKDADQGERIVAEYGLDDVSEKCRYLARLVKNDDSYFTNMEEAIKFQHFAGNFVAALGTLDFIERFPKKEDLMKPVFTEKVIQFDSYLNSQLDNSDYPKDPSAIH